MKTMQLRTTLLVAAGAAALTAGCGSGKNVATPQAAARNAVTVMSATMSGAAALPPGPDAGAGTAEITLNKKTGKVCWRMAVSGIDKPLSAHVHRAPTGKPGPVVIPLGDRFSTAGCVLTPTRALRAVAQSPTSYYVDVHTTEHLDGAVRGQLHASA